MKHILIPSETLLPSLALAMIGKNPISLSPGNPQSSRPNAAAPNHSHLGGDPCPTCDLVEIPYHADLPVLNYTE